MKVNPKPLDKNYGKVILYLNDLKAIYDELSPYTSNVIIKNDQYTFEDWQDFVENFRDGKTISFGVNNFAEDIYITVNIYQSYASITTGLLGKSEKLAGIIHNIDNIISPAQKKKYKLLTPWAFFVCAISFFIIFFKKVPLYNQYEEFYKTLMCVLGLLNIMFYFYWGSTSKIILVHKAEDKNIFQRTIDDIFTNVMGSIITAILGFIGGVIASKLGLLPFLK